MHPLRHPLLADENVAPAVILGLRQRGCEVVGVVELGLGGRSDVEILDRAWRDGRPC